MQIFSRLFLVLGGFYWACLVFALVLACGGGKNCENSYGESAFWASAVLLLFVLPVIANKSLLVRVLSITVFIVFLILFSSYSGSLWNASRFFQKHSWLNWTSLSLEIIPLLFVLGAIMLNGLSFFRILRYRNERK